MDAPIIKSDLKSRLLRLVKSDEPARGGVIPGSAGQDRTIAKRPLWQRYWKPGAAALLVCAGAAWLLAGPGGNVYRAPLNQLTIGTVRQGPFEDYIAVRGSVAVGSTHATQPARAQDSRRKRATVIGARRSCSKKLWPPSNTPKRAPGMRAVSAMELESGAMPS